MGWVNTSTAANSWQEQEKGGEILRFTVSHWRKGYSHGFSFDLLLSSSSLLFYFNTPYSQLSVM